MTGTSQLAALLDSGAFVVTAECGPPRDADPAMLERKAAVLRGYVDACNVTDNQTARVHMCSLAACRVLIENGIEPVMQMTVRDRNRLALQADLLGAYALGVRNVLCLHGDPQDQGDHPDAKGVYDLDSIDLMGVLKGLRAGVYQNGQPIKGQAPQYFIGGAANPFADGHGEHVERLRRKVAAGAHFVQTQCVFNVERFEAWFAQLREAGVHREVHILAGVTPLKSARMAEYMATRVGGIDMPDEIRARMAGVPKERQAEEGRRIALEIIDRLRRIEGLSGLHIMAVEWESSIPGLIEAAGLWPRPVLA